MQRQPISSPRSRWHDVARVIGLLGSEADRLVLPLGLVTVLVVVLGGALAALAPLLLKSLVDSLSTLHEPTMNTLFSSLGKPCAEYVLLLLAMRVLGDVRPLLSVAVNQRLYSRIALRFFEHVLRLPIGFLLKQRGAELLHRLDLASAGAQLVVAHLAASVLPVLVELVTMAAVLIHLEQPTLIGVFGAAALAYLFIFAAGAPRMTAAAHGVSAASLEMAAQLGEGVANVETLRCFSAEQDASRRLRDVGSALEQAWLKLNRLNLVIALAASVTFVLSMAACLFIGARSVEEHALTIGGFVLTTMYMLQMVRPLESLGVAARDLARALGYLQPLIDLLSQPLPDAVHYPAKTAAKTLPRALAVRFEEVHFAYEPDRPVLQGVDFEVLAGGMTAIVGRSGSGKSSLARLLMRLYEPQSGHILLDGRAIDSIRPSDLRGGLIGLVSQETALLHDTIAGNIAVGAPSATLQDIRRAACAAQLDGLLSALPLGLDTPVGDRGLQLSGGERQRVGIARALLRRPGLYVLDEPTSMLDSKTEGDILKALRSASEGSTLLVIAHRLSTIVDANEIIVLDGGRVRERGTHESLLAMNGLYAEMWRRQMAGSR